MKEGDTLITFPTLQRCFNLRNVEEFDISRSGHAVTVKFTSGKESKYQGEEGRALIEWIERNAQQLITPF